MITIKLHTDEIITGFNENDIIKKLANQGNIEESKKRIYMQEVARRIKIYYGRSIKFKNDLEFISELEKVGVLKTVKNDHSS